MKKRIGIDLDSTVADYMAGAIPLLEEHYGLTPDYSKPAYKIEEVFGLTTETRPSGMRQFLYEEMHLFRDLPVIEGMDQLTHKLREQDITIYFITARAGTKVIRQDTFTWLEKNNFAFEDVFFTERKAELCALTNTRVMIDDELKQIKSLQGMGVHVVVPACPWNQLLSEHSGPGMAIRVDGWQETLSAVEEFLL